MPNLSQEVWNFLIVNLPIQKHLRKELLNVRALARYIIKEKNLDASLDAVISAIRRFSNDQESFQEMINIEDLFKDSSVTTKNNLMCVTLRDQSDILKYLMESMKITDFEKRETLRLIKGKNNLKVLIDFKNLEKIKKIFPDNNLDIKKGLSEIRIKTSLKADQTKGVVSRISSELMIRNINISEIIFCVPEIIVYIHQEDLLDAHESIMNLCNAK